MAALRTQRMERIVLSMAPGDRSKIAVELECGRNGITKTYGVHCVGAGAYTRSLQSSTRGPSGHIARARAQLEHLRDTSTSSF